jgi:hypothetical protein
VAEHVALELLDHDKEQDHPHDRRPGLEERHDHGGHGGQHAGPNIGTSSNKPASTPAMWTVKRRLHAGAVVGVVADWRRLDVDHFGFGRRRGECVVQVSMVIIVGWRS